MRGYVLEAKGKATWKEVPMPVLGPNDALVRPTAVATCTTDVHMIATAALPKTVGKVIGHEAVGVVEKVGGNVKAFKPGDRVVLPCGNSDWRHPRAQRGEAKYYQTNSPYYSDDPSIGGVFSEYVRTLDADLNLARIPDTVSDLQAVMLPDMAATGFTGVERLGIQFGETVLVMGLGPVGLMAVAGAALRGAGRIIGVDSRPNTEELARTYGVTDIVDFASGQTLENVMALTGGQPVDSVLIASGGTASEVFTTALRAVKFGGRVACVSGFLHDESVTIPLEVWNYGFMEKFLTGVHVQDGRDWIERLLAMLECGRFDTRPLVSHVLEGWDSLEQGIELMRSRDSSVIKPVIVI